MQFVREKILYKYIRDINTYAYAYNKEFDMGLSIDPVKRKPIKEPNLMAQPVKVGDFTTTFNKMGTMIGDALRSGQVNAPSNAAAGL